MMLASSFSFFERLTMRRKARGFNSNDNYFVQKGYEGINVHTRKYERTHVAFEKKNHSIFVEFQKTVTL